MDTQILQLILKAQNETKDALKDLRGDLDQTRKSADQNKEAFSKLKGEMVTLAAQYLTIKGAIALVTGALQAQGEQEAAINKLNLALVNQGHYSEATSKSLVDYAASLQSVSTFADEVILEGEAMLASFGMNEAQIKNTTKAALDFAAATKTDLTTAINLLGKAYAGNTAALSRYGIVVDEGLSKTQKFEAAVSQIEQRFGGSAATATQTYTGALEQLKNQAGEVQEGLGKLLGELSGSQAPFSIATEACKSFAKFLSEDAVTALSEFRARWLETIADLVDGGEAGGLASAVKGNILSMFGITGSDAGTQAAAAYRAAAAEIRTMGDAAAAGSGKVKKLSDEQIAAAKAAAELAAKTKAAAEAKQAAADATSRLAKANKEFAEFVEREIDAIAEEALALKALGDQLLTDQLASSWERIDKAAMEAGRTQVDVMEMAIAMAREEILENIRRADQHVLITQALYGEGRALEAARAAAAAARAEWTGQGQAIDAAKEKAEAFGMAVDFVAEMFHELGGDAESALGRMISGLVAGAAAAKAAKAALTDKNGEPISFVDATKAQQAQVAMAGLTTAMAAYRAGALGGAIAGAQFGATFGPIGAAIGAAAGGLLGWIGGASRAREEARRLAAEARALALEISKMRTEFIASQGGIEILELAAAEAGVSLQAMWDAKTVEAYNEAVNRVRESIELHESAVDKVKEAMDRWGLTIEDMGPAFQSQMLHEGLAEIWQDFALIQAAGGDLAKLLSGEMGDAIQQLVSQSISMGVALPESVRPMIQKMIELGLLFDENGEKITDISQLTFTETLEAGVARLITQIERLVRALLGIPQEINTNVNVNTHHNNHPPQDQDPPTDPPVGPGHSFGGTVPWTPGAGRWVKVGETKTEHIMSDEQLLGMMARAGVMASGAPAGGGRPSGPDMLHLTVKFGNAAVADMVQDLIDHRMITVNV